MGVSLLCGGCRGGHVIAAVADSDQAPAAPPAEDGIVASGQWIVVAVAAALAVGSIAFLRRRRWLVLPVRGEADAPDPPDAAAWLIGLFLLQVLAPMVPVMALRGAIDFETLGGRAAIQWLSYVAQLPFAAAIVMRLVAVRRLAPMRPAAAGAGALGLVLAAPLILAGSQAASIVQRLASGAAPPELGHDTLRAIVASRSDPWAWVVIAAVTVGAPIFEEIAYRGALQGAFRSLDIRPWPTILLTSAFFLIMHLGAIPSDALPSAMTGLAILSVSLGVLRERTGGLLAPMVAHSLFNVANLALAWASSGG